MRPIDKIRHLYGALAPNHLTTVVDIGANPFAGTPPYGTLRRSDCCQVIGFEPQEDALNALLKTARHNDLFLPYAIGDGSTRPLYITRNSGLVSNLRPMQDIARLLGPWWQRATEVTATQALETRRLDDIKEVPRVDFLKIDIQGGELDVFRHARTKLKECSAIQTEICLHPYYENQPSFGDIQSELTAQGFMIHKFVEISAHPISNTLDRDKTEKKHRSQVTVADLIFIRNPADMTRSDTEKLKHLTLLSFAVFRSYDLTLRCLSDLCGAGALDSELLPDLIRKLEI